QHGVRGPVCIDSVHGKSTRAKHRVKVKRTYVGPGGIPQCRRQACAEGNVRRSRPVEHWIAETNDLTCQWRRRLDQRHFSKPPCAGIAIEQLFKRMLTAF